MALSDTIDLLVERAITTGVSQYRQQRITLYAAGLKGKIRQTELALSRLTEFDNQSDEYTTSSVPDEFTIKERVHFYCDAFWTFLFSSLDVLAQIVNQAMKLGFEEGNISFKNVNTKLQGNTYKGTGIAKKFKTCCGSRSFKNLYRYRNCSIHRRQIFIKEKATSSSESVTNGYPSTSTGPIVNVERILCDDPLYVKPTVEQGRSIPEYMVKTQNNILNHIQNILEEISIVR